ncbi:MAG: nitroreductase family protein [Deltaproteobacteria bacterium HGW-Deltaproteobacteria-13]|jgi:nitroreductase|nr:MAG: nitroreductase family protein [Deltaproteobacteria bacterium HGW-Deltaproteobacteria-13]
MEFKETMRQRRAVNFFDTTKDVTDAQLKEIIETAALAPSSSNLQPWKVIVLRDMDKKETLKKVAMNQPKITEAPVVLIVLGDREGWKKGNADFEKGFVNSVKAGHMKQEQYDQFVNSTNSLYGISSERQLAFACKNAGFFAMSLMLAAKDAGLDSHPMDGFDIDGVRKAFNISDQYWIPLLMAIGHFDKSKTLLPPKWRKNYDEIVVNF